MKFLLMRGWGVWLLAPAVAFICAVPCRASDYPTYEAHTDYIGGYPAEAETDYSDECQGLAHDQDHWYITSRNRIWRSPVWRSLGSVGYGAEGVTYTSINVQWPLWENGYDHLGDPDVYTDGGTDYLLVPIEGGSPGPGIAAFRADDLAYPPSLGVLSEGGAPWCAVDNEGRLFATPYRDVGTLFSYGVDWDAVEDDPNFDLVHTPEFDIVLKDENGYPLTLSHVQGGEFSDSGEVIFMVCGSADDDEWHPSWGISVFDVATGRRLEKSCNGCGRFNYQFSPGWSKYEEPEGLTVWDLDDGSAPSVSGQLHVVLLDNDADQDDVYIKHYTHRQHLVPGGTSVNDIHEQAWSGSAMSFSDGHYPEAVVFDKMIRLEAKSGTARIGD